MAASWVLEEMRSVDLRDKRLDERLRTVLSQLSERPAASIPAACGGRAEMTAAYRFFDNEKAEFDAILQPHATATLRRLAAQPTAILVQDTTEIDLTREQPVAGAGRLSDSSRRGVFLHLLHAFTPDGTPLGSVAAQAWTRGEEVGAADQSRAERARTPIEEKESFRWLTTWELARQAAADCPAVQCICVADSESDIYEVLEAAAGGEGPDWVVRACQNRALSAETDSLPLRERVAASPALFRQTISVRGRRALTACETRSRRQSRESREAETTVRAARVTLRPPHRPNRKPAAATLNVVLVREEQPPQGEEPIEWLLLTSLPIEDAEQVRQVIDAYRVRWMIEIFFRVLKSGCRVEERRFEAVDRVLACLAVYLIVAWRTLYVCRLGRSCPQLDCETIFEPAEWKATWKIIRRTDPPKSPPALGVMIKLVARLGGYVERQNSPPGPQTLWLGLQRVHDFALCWEKFGPDAKPPDQLV